MNGPQLDTKTQPTAETTRDYITAWRPKDPNWIPATARPRTGRDHAIHTLGGPTTAPTSTPSPTGSRKGSPCLPCISSTNS
jgi:hypothetical protein